MSNPIQTYRLIVTLPAVTGEEADQIAADLEGDMHTPNGRGDYYDPSATVTHALGESLPAGFAIMPGRTGRGDARMILGTPGKNSSMTALEARQLAGVLLAHAHTIENGA